MQQLADASLTRLKNWDISDEQIKALASSGNARRTLTFRSPVSGIVTEKKAVQGMRFMPGEALYQVADLSTVWVIADVFEQDIGLVKTGAGPGRINAYPDKKFEGKRHLRLSDAEGRNAHGSGSSRTGQPRPAAQAGDVRAGGTGGRATALRWSPCRLPPSSTAAPARSCWCSWAKAASSRARSSSARAATPMSKCIDGVKDGEQVVVAANFLIDAESNLKAAVGGFGFGAHYRPPATAQDAAAAKAGQASTVHQAEGTVDSIDAKRVRHASATARSPASSGRR
jgi:Cu(I)/Ag(I) efflux system membrane fusion protein